MFSFSNEKQPDSRDFGLSPDEQKPHYGLIPVRVVVNVYKVILAAIIPEMHPDLIAVGQNGYKFSEAQISTKNVENFMRTLA